jgi:hypothetical protein
MKGESNNKMLIIRNMTKQDIRQIINLQKKSFADMAEYGMIWPSFYLENHIDIFPEGQFCAEVVYNDACHDKKKEEEDCWLSKQSNSYTKTTLC